GKVSGRPEGQLRSPETSLGLFNRLIAVGGQVAERFRLASARRSSGPSIPLQPPVQSLCECEDGHGPTQRDAGAAPQPEARLQPGSALLYRSRLSSGGPRADLVQGLAVRRA